MNRFQLSLIAVSLITTSLTCRYAEAMFEPAPDTPTATLTASLTPSPSATPNRTATAEFKATWQATLALATVIPELGELGFSKELGELVWVQNENLDLIATGEDQMLYWPLDLDLVASDFLMGFDITWNSSSGIAGCGIILRAEDFEDGEQVLFRTLRLSGYPGWELELYRNGIFQASLSGYMRGDDHILQKGFSTNQYVLEAKGLTVRVWANGESLGAGTLNEQRIDGKFGVFIYQDSGTTTCKFNNGWIMAPKEAEN